ncbi:MAG: TolC family protein [Bryobacterales bacterium]|nr:TolC family protein [Bryobacterales bacterium]
MKESAATGFFGRFKAHYEPRDIAPIRLNNSSRLESLLRAGKLYLSLRDTVALALENNLDIELQRYGPEISKASLMRAEAGGLLRGVPPTVQAGPASAAAQATGSQTGGFGGGGAAQRTGAGSAGGDTGGTVITATGTALQNLDPVFVTSVNLGHQTRPQANTVTTGLTSTVFDFTQHSYALQKSWLAGTTTSFAWNNTNLTGNNPLSDINPSKTSNFQLQVSQRLLQGFGRAVNNRNIRIQKNNMKVTDLQFRLQVITTIAAVTNLYWDLVSFNEDVKVKQRALALAQKLFEDNKKQVEIGTLAPIEIVSAEAQVARRQQELLTSETGLLQQETIIKNALSRTGVSSPSVADARIVPTDKIQVPDVEPVQPISDIYEQAVQERPDIQQTRINIENAKIGLLGSRSQMLPSLDLQGNLQNNALAGSVNALLLRGVPIPRNVDPYFVGGFGTALGQLFRRNFPDYSIGFQLNVPLRNRSAQADMIIDSLDLRQRELNQQRSLNQLRVDIQNALIAVRQARARYETALKEQTLQEQTLDAEQKKYALGASTVYFVIQYQRDLAQAQSNVVAALASYAKSRVDLERITGQTIKVNDINITEAMAGQVSRPPDALPAEK